MRVAPLFLLPLTLLAGCNGGGSGNSTAAVTSATPVAAVAPPAGKTWLDVVSKTSDGYIQGNPNAPIKLLEYGSRTCPVCGHFANTGVEPLRAKYVSTGKVSYEFREFWVHPQDAAPSLLGNCVSTEAFFPVLDQMYAQQTELNAKIEQVYAQVQSLQKTQQPLAYAVGLGYLDFIKQRGVPEEKARQCLTDPALVKTINDRINKGIEKGVNGTPTFFINDKKVDDVVAWEQLEPRLQAAGAR
ncbi:thioredoxin domain-containing protein [Sphingomonas sp.]|uniref:DsbA family protein n=1 Tax=Sphingomonas sp. TaxID=28214 RepID=UPI001B170528|nr:thioredoxin domain-containing protein [Sphingomonas sp.]MBO9714185.1 thioredoxin domain-containing protein [Sphingomonas sp.]